MRFPAHYLEGMRGAFGLSQAYWISDSARIKRLSDGTTYSIDERGDDYYAWFDEMRQGEDEIMLRVDSPEDSTEEQYLFINSRITDHTGRFAGVVGIAVDLRRLRLLVRKYEVGYNIRINLVDQENRIMVDTDPNNTYYSIANLTLTHKDSDYNYTVDRDGNYVATKFIKEFNWYLVIRSNVAKAIAVDTKVIIGNVVLAIVMILSLVGINAVIYRQQRQITLKSITDPLTGISNRLNLEAQLKEYLRRGQGQAEGTLFMIDLDHFKDVNDNLGHPMGDTLLKDTASRLRKTFRESDLVGRLGGDEFMVFAKGLTDERKIRQLADQLNREARILYKSEEGHHIHVSMTVGVAIAPQHGGDYSTIYKHADTALYTAKERGRDQYVLYSKRLDPDDGDGE
ncbi:MAG: sensor domain-containing diguanylate cyclase [Succinivibrionaceae bacterium]|nr:sensor domain-containing diguanylate cyclase [Succinivibrionaceae bacterium]